MRAVSVALRAFRKPDVDLATLQWDDRSAGKPLVVPEAIFALAGSPSNDTLKTVRTDAMRAVAAGAKTVRVDIDELAVLDSAVIGTLILLLRAARECNAEVVLRASRENIIGTLQQTALDKVFVIETPSTTTICLC